MTTGMQSRELPTDNQRLNLAINFGNRRLRRGQTGREVRVRESQIVIRNYCNAIVFHTDSMLFFIINRIAYQCNA